uniref:Uncharacterized protein n=1 Tax=Coccidioides posadasii RMSCC 3488 TaxID=454284 RepID=A0A0J6I9Y8_COCPO|nr:hypothetical protein CPAG_04734 [Coccidioides posadasii RMSCC 3488]
MQGWNVVLTEHRLDTTWQVLQHTDQQLLPTYGTAQRLAVLYVMKLQLHYLLTDEYIPGTPSFLHASQAITKGSSATLPTSNITPGFREYLLVWPDSYDKFVYAGSSRALVRGELQAAS